MGGEGKQAVSAPMEANPILYVAFPVQLAFAEQLSRLWSAVELRPSDCKPKSPLHMHLTLLYLGEIRQRYVNSTIEGIEYRLKELPTGTFRFNRFHSFPSRNKSYIVAAADVDEQERWDAFLHKARRGFRDILAPHLDDRPWAPHVSVATFPNALSGSFSMNAPFLECSWKPPQIAIYRKDSPDGSGYQLHSYELA